MQYVSELIGSPVRDPDGRVVARVADLLVPADADYPAVDALALKPPKGDPRTVPWSAFRKLADGVNHAVIEPNQSEPAGAGLKIRGQFVKFSQHLKVTSVELAVADMRGFQHPSGDWLGSHTRQDGSPVVETELAQCDYRDRK